MLSGKGMYLWLMNRCGSIGKIVSDSQTMGLSYVMVKIADGTGSGGNDINSIKALRDALKAIGIQLWGWQYIYLKDPAGEAKLAVSQMNILNLDGFIIDAEVECLGQQKGATVYSNALRNGLPNAQIVLSTFRFPNYFPTFPFKEFLNVSNLNMPQVYWMGAHNPADQLERCVTEYEALYKTLKINPVPIVPTGAAFTQGGWTATTSEIDAFHNKAVSLASKGRIISSDNWWEFYQVQIGKFMPTIANQTWGNTPPPPPPGPIIPPLPANVQVVTGEIRVRSTPIALTDLSNVFGSLKPTRKGEKVTAIAQEARQDASGNLWARIGVNTWICMIYLGQELAKFV